jgi:hypothetical protein
LNKGLFVCGAIKNKYRLIRNMRQLNKTDEIVGFKSYPEFYMKEKKGIKPNTVRLVDVDDKRFQKLRNGEYSRIRIINTQTKEYFEREIIDRTFFIMGCNELVIISWK